MEALAIGDAEPAVNAVEVEAKTLGAIVAWIRRCRSKGIRPLVLDAILRKQFPELTVEERAALFDAAERPGAEAT